MKKILLLITISLLFSGNAYTNEEIDKALEKCADTQIAYGNIKNIDKSYYEDNEIYKIMLSEKNALQLKYDEAGDIFKNPISNIGQITLDLNTRQEKI
jgi:hypothetical protein